MTRAARKACVGLLTTLLAAASLAGPDAGQAPTSGTSRYVHVDQATGLSIELPGAWARGDPQAVKDSIVAARARVAGPEAADAVRSMLNVLFVLRAQPYAGPPGQRPMISCMATAAPPGMTPEEAGEALEFSLQAASARVEEEAKVSGPARDEVGGQAVFRASVEAKDRTYRFLKALRKGVLIDCSATAHGAFIGDVERAFASVSFR